MLELFRSRRRAVVWFIDTALFGTVVFVVAGLILGWERATRIDRLFDAATITLVAQVSLYYHGLYGRIAREKFSAVSFRIVRALVLAFAVIYFVLPWTLEDAEDRSSTVLATFILAGLVLPPMRAAFVDLWLARFRPPLLILGSSSLAMACAEATLEPDAGFLYVGRIVPDEEAFLFFDKPDIVGTFSQLRRVVYENGIRRILVCQAQRRGKLPVTELLELKFSGVEIEEGADFYERQTGRVFASELRPSQLVFADGYRITRRTLLFKRWLDVLGASIGLVLAFPLMVFAAIAVKLSSRGPVIYSQERMGVLGKRFLIHKFRSMRIDAEADGPKFASENDPRVTTVGRFLRKTRIDELPQLWNVLQGDMSLVGPRPERPAFVEQLEEQIPYFHQRLFVKPGVTGHAQVSCKYSAALEDHQEKLEHDLFYIKNVSVLFDISILIDTVKVVLMRVGSR